MTRKMREKLKNYPNMVEMFLNIPENLWDIFWPKNDREKFLLESQIMLLKIRETERNKVMRLQKLCGLPLRPNQLLSEVAAMARRKGKKNC
ncbi:MAG: hypothetical protein KAR42_07030 [candidate division Zixibacteria bacterium]|nr:hypothetical protein [candidate division Zixibacteria bacterium]